MAGKIVVHTPGYMGVAKLCVFINDVDQGVKMGAGSKQAFDVPNGASVVVKIVAGIAGSMSSEPIYIRDGYITEARFFVVQGLWKNTVGFEVLKETPLEECEEKPEEKAVFEFDGGVGDKLTVYEDRVVIKHKGVLNFLAMGINGDKVVYLTDITGVQFKPAGVVNGHIQFSMLGGNESKGGVLNAAGDENTITFCERMNFEAQEIQEYLNKKLREIKTAKNTPIMQAAPVSAAEELKKFKELLDMGVITQEEFDAKKKQLLGL